MKSRTSFVLAIAILLSLPVMVHAQPGHGFDYKMEKLDLTDQQQEQLKTEMMNHRKQMITQKAEVQVAKLEYFEALNGGASDKEVRNKMEALNSAKNELAAARTEHQLRVREIVGAENFAMFHRQMCGFQGKGMRECGHPGMKHGKKDGPHHGMDRMHRMPDRD